MKQYDAIIIGGGHNGLVAAAALARAGQSVLVLERREVLGGAAATEEVFPGHRVNTGAHDASLLLPEVVDALDLRRHGLDMIESPANVVCLQPGRAPLTFWRDDARSQAEIAKFSRVDADKYLAFLAAIQRFTDVLSTVMLLTPPDLAESKPLRLLPWARIALGVRRLGKKDMLELLRILPMPVVEYLDGWFESDALKGALAAGGVTGGHLGPSAAGTTFMLLYQRLGPAGRHQFVRGGIGQLSAAAAAAARARGAEIRTGAGVARINLYDDGLDGAANGVTLDDGTTIRARAIISSSNARATLFGLVGAENLEPRFMRQVRNIRYRGATAKVNLALNGLPRFTGLGDDSEALSGHILLSPSVEYLERAADAAKYGRWSQHPLLDAVIPTVLDPSLAPAGHHVMSITVQWAPYALRESDWDQQGEVLGDCVVARLAEFAPGLREQVRHRQVLTPLDWERTYGLTEGSPFQGEMGLDQLVFMRPVPGYAQYRTPIAGLYLCGAAAHPGGGVTGAPGFNAAREILRDLYTGIGRAAAT